MHTIAKGNPPPVITKRIGEKNLDKMIKIISLLIHTT
jgi:hypothetical protein